MNPYPILQSVIFCLAVPWLMSSQHQNTSLSDILSQVNADPPLIRRQGDSLYYTGTLQRAAVERIVSEYTSKSGLHRLIIDSTGGEVNTGMMLGRWVHDLQLDVEVRALCFSSCANYVFAAGKHQLIGSHALVGWHGSTFQQNLMTPESLREAMRPGLVQSFSQLPIEVQQNLNFDAFLKQQVADFFADMEESRQKETLFYKRLQLNSDLANLREYCRRTPGNYTLTLDGMQSMGLKHVSGPKDYPQTALAYHNKRRQSKVPALPPLDILVMKGLNCLIVTDNG